MSDQQAGQLVSGPWFPGAYPITQGFMPGLGAYEPQHTGIDVGLPSGTPLLAAVAGVIKDLVDPSGFGFYQTLTPDASPDQTFLLGHESAWDVASGAHVAAGQQVASSGSTGWSTGPHLHFQENVGGSPINPLAALTSGPAATAPAASGGVGGPSAADLCKYLPVPLSLPFCGSQAAGAAGAVAGDVGAGLTSIGQGIQDFPKNVGHGVADFISAGTHNLEVALSRQIVALVVAAAVLLILFL